MESSVSAAISSSASVMARQRVRYWRMASRRSCALGRSMKKISENLPLRNNSAGRAVTLLAVATRNTRPVDSCSQ